jgi:translation initiation factor IF-3
MANYQQTNKLKKPEDPLLLQYPANNLINANELRVVDTQGVNLGILSFRDALYKARQEDLDLVVVNIEAKPPIAKILDYNKFIYDLRIAKKTQAKKNRANTVVLKEIQLSPRIVNHDLEIKINHAKKFLEDNNKVKVVIKFKGREMSFSQKGFEVINKFIQDLGQYKLEKAPELNGRSIVAMILPNIKKEKI